MPTRKVGILYMSLTLAFATLASPHRALATLAANPSFQDPTTGSFYYYDSTTGLYYDADNGYYFDPRTMTFETSVAASGAVPVAPVRLPLAVPTPSYAPYAPAYVQAPIVVPDWQSRRLENTESSRMWDAQRRQHEQFEQQERERQAYQATQNAQQQAFQQQMAQQRAAEAIRERAAIEQHQAQSQQHWNAPAGCQQSHSEHRC